MPSLNTYEGATEAYRSTLTPVLWNSDHAQPALGIGLTPIIAVGLGLVAAHGRRFATSATNKHAHDQIGRNSAGNCEK